MMIRMGILGCSDIAFKRFLPAAGGIEDLEVVVIAEEYDKTKLGTFCRAYNLEQEENFEKLIARRDIDAVYIPQPPILHFEWAQKALQQGKHVLIEKPATTQYSLSKKLVDLAESSGLALHENYMFQYHSQVEAIKTIISDGDIGDIRLIRADFGFPLRGQNDFRYSRALGGGALLDAGGYTTKLATILLGDTIKADTACLNYLPAFEVDMYGSVSFSNEKGVVCQTGFGMDCSYRCSLEVWGSKGRLYTNRIFTAPDDYNPVVKIEVSGKEKEIRLNTDSHFQRSIERFLEEIKDFSIRKKMYEEILLQAKLVDDIKKISTI